MRSISLLLLLACAADPVAGWEPPGNASNRSMTSAPAQPAQVEEALPPEEPPPAGKIGGEPILPRPIVLGAIGTDAVEAAVTAESEAIGRCWERHGAQDPSRAGKVLVKFTIAADGAVSSATTRSTSLRHEPTERCLNEVVSQIRFPPLQTGRLAVVHYPFAFGPAEPVTTPR